MDARQIANCGTDSELSVTTSVYTIQFVMNEDNPDALGVKHIEEFAAEIQRVMDDADFTTNLRYNAINFEVVSRIVIATTSAP